MGSQKQQSTWSKIPSAIKFTVTIIASIVTILIGLNKLGYFGEQDLCIRINCLNGGKCNNGKCICPDGYDGNNCEKKINPCLNITCLNGGVCNNGSCDCPAGYRGLRCQTRDLKDNEILDGRDESIYAIKEIGQNWWIVDNINYNVQGSKCIDCEKNGRLYTFEMARQVCPAGWRLPNSQDFQSLINESGSIKRAVRNADIKYIGRYGRSSHTNTFVGVGEFAMFWTNSSTSRGQSHFFFNKLKNKARADVQGNDQFFSCRCIKS